MMKTLTRTQTLVMAITLLIAVAAPSPSYADKPSTPVLVVNDQTNPVPVQVSGSINAPVVVREAKTPFAAERILFLDVGNAGILSIPLLTNAPAGKRAVVETVTAELFLPGGQFPTLEISTILNQSAGIQTVSHHLLLTKESSPSGTDFYGVTFPIRLYGDHSSDPATYPSVQANFGRAGGSTGVAYATVTISGYFEEAP